MSKITIIEGNSNDKDNVRVLMVKGEKGEQGDLNHNDIVDNLTSTATDKVLSAKQGKVLKDLVDGNTTDISTNATNISNETSARQSADTNLQNNINAEATTRANADNNLQSQITGLASGSPKAVNSISQMTDTTKNYVLTTDGHWYYYNGTNWADGGVYQATGIADNSIEYPMFSNEVKDNFKAVIDNEKINLISTVRFERGSIQNGAGISSTSKIRSDYIDVSKITEITCDPGSEYKFLAFFYTDKDESTFIGSTYGSYFTKFNGAYQTTKQNIHVLPQFKYIRFVIGNALDDTTIVDIDEATNVTAVANYQLYNNREDYDKEHQPFFEWLDDKRYTLDYDTWENGIPGAVGDDFLIGNALYRICTGLIDVSKIKGNLILETETGYKCGYYFCDSNFAWISRVYWDTSYNVPIPQNAKYLIVGLAKTTENTDISSSDYNNVTISFETSYNISKLEDISNNEYIDFGWELGTLVPGSGVEDNSSTRLRSNYLYVGKGTNLVIENSLYDHLIYKYDLNKIYKSDLSWTNATITVEEDCYIRILVRKHNNSTISDGEISTILANEKIYRAFPQSMIGINITDDIPSYFQENLSNAINTVKNNIFDSAINGDSFIFITDIHWQSNAKNSPMLIEKVVDNINVDKIICGGDLIGGGEKSAMINLMNECVNSFKDITRFYTLLGNHDTNHIGAGSSDDYFSKGEAYSLMQKQSDFIMNYENPCYYYFDNPTTKTRYICLDTGLEGTTLDSTQSAWITDTLASMPDGYHALVFAHIIYQPTTSWHIGLTPSELERTSFMNDVCTILDTFNTNNSNKKVEAIFGGHVHIDCNFATSGGIPIVLTDCDTRQTFTETSSGSGVRNQELGTVNEQCFDITTIDYTNRTIKCVRVGRGADRSITY